MKAFVWLACLSLAATAAVSITTVYALDPVAAFMVGTVSGIIGAIVANILNV